MTERHEVTLMIEGVKEVLVEVDYEVITDPGNGEEFKDKLRVAALLLRQGQAKLEEAEAMLPDTGQ